MSEVILYFLKLGFLGFGGPLALIAMMQEELIERRKWMSETEFTAVLPLIKSMPGPVAFQLSVYLGRHRAGTLAGLLAGTMLILPSFVMMVFFAAFANAYSGIAWIHFLLEGMQLAALGTILLSVVPLFRPYQQRPPFWLLVAVAAALCLRLFSWEPLIIIGAGGIGVLLSRKKPETTARSPLLISLLLVCVKAGAFVFGTGLAIIPMLESDVVLKYHWLTHPEFMNALAFGQITPGPVTTTVTYIGYKVLGFGGAFGATLATFAPATFHMLTWFPRVTSRLTRATWIKPFIFGSIAAVVGSIAVALYHLGHSFTWTPLMAAVVLVAIILQAKRWLPGWATIPVMGAVYAALMSSGIFH